MRPCVLSWYVTAILVACRFGDVLSWEYCTPGSEVDGLTCSVKDQWLSQKSDFNPGSYPRLVPSDGSSVCFSEMVANISAGQFHFGLIDLEFQLSFYDGSDFQLVADYVGVQNVLVRSGDQCENIVKDKEYVLSASYFCCSFSATPYSRWSLWDRFSLGGNVVLILILIIIICCIRRGAFKANVNSASTKNDQNLHIELGSYKPVPTTPQV